MKNLVLRKSALKVFAILLTTSMLISCSKDEEEEPGQTSPADVSYSIELVKISAEDITESDGIIEVYGTVNSLLKRDNITEQNMILSLSESNYIAVGTSDTPLSNSFTYVVPAANVEDSVLEIIASLTDRDPVDNDNEFLGTRTFTVPLPNIDERVEYEMTFDDDSPNIVRLTYTIERL